MTDKQQPTQPILAKGLKGVIATETALSDVRGERISLAFGRFLRPSRVFSSTRELIDTVMGNIEDIRSEFGQSGVHIR